MYDKLVWLTFLYDFYGQLLTEKQINILNMYCDENLSLSEISEQLSISRQGVYDSLKRAEHTLEEYENKLGLLGKFMTQKEELKNVKELLNEALKSESSDETKEKLSQLVEHINKLL